MISVEPTTTTVRQIALDQPATIRVFEKLGIDYCCGGRKPLAQACEEHALDLETVVAAIETELEHTVHGPTSPDWTTASITALCDHIVNDHHAYIRNELPRLHALAAKVVSRHGDQHPELASIQQLLETAGEELLEHLAKEEAVLFPYLRKLDKALASDGQRPKRCFGAVSDPIRVMMAEHDAAGALFAQIRKLSGGYTAPEGACPSWRGFYQGLLEFEQDLHRHVHLENNILFPNAIALEEGHA